MLEFDISKELRTLADGIPEDETVLLPATKPNLWRDCTVEVAFEQVEISNFLRFIADMVE